jgi:hypothetical protein
MGVTCFAIKILTHLIHQEFANLFVFNADVTHGDGRAAVIISSAKKFKARPKSDPLMVAKGLSQGMSPVLPLQIYCFSPGPDHSTDTLAGYVSIAFPGTENLNSRVNVTRRAA